MIQYIRVLVTSSIAGVFLYNLKSILTIDHDQSFKKFDGLF